MRLSLPRRNSPEIARRMQTENTHTDAPRSSIWPLYTYVLCVIACYSITDNCMTPSSDKYAHMVCILLQHQTVLIEQRGLIGSDMIKTVCFSRNEIKAPMSISAIDWWPGFNCLLKYNYRLLLGRAEEESRNGRPIGPALGHHADQGWHSHETPHTVGYTMVHGLACMLKNGSMMYFILQ